MTKKLQYRPGLNGLSLMVGYFSKEKPGSIDQGIQHFNDGGWVFQGKRQTELKGDPQTFFEGGL